MAGTYDWATPGAKAEVTERFGIYEPGSIVYIDEEPGDNGVATVVPEPGSTDWQFMPMTHIKPTN
jgi:hypothetical protein